MKIKLAKSAGFCFGVKKAIQTAFETANSNKTVEMLGDIVHNEDVIKRIGECGIKKVTRLKKGRNKTLLIRAHGASKKTFHQAKKLGYKIVDATCPMVKEIHKIAEQWEKKGFKIIIIGDRHHDEVLGIVGQLKNKALVIDSSKNMPAKTMKKAAVVVQSTQNMEKTMKIVELLKKRVENLEFFNTICNPTREKQSEMKTLPLKNDVMIIIGSKTSANTKRLYQISKSLNKKSYWIQSAKDIKPGWFSKIKNAGITAGASTPQETTDQVIKRIKTITKTKQK